jgi:putative superfamily III holin-X
MAIGHNLGAILLGTPLIASMTMANQDVHNDLSLSGALQRVVDSSQHLMLAHISSLRLEVKEDLGRALSSVFFIGAGVILINGAWLSLMAFTLQGLNEHLSMFASLALVGTFTGLIGVGLALAGVQRLHQLKVEPDAAQIKRAELGA